MTASVAPRSRPPRSSSRRARSAGSPSARRRDRPLADPFDEVEEVGPGLFGDDLAEQRAEQADLGRERVAGAGRPDAAGSARDRGVTRRPRVRHATIAPGPFGAESPPDRNLSAATFPYACIVMVVTPPVRLAATPARAAAAAKRPRATAARHADDQLAQLRFLHEVARLATTAQTWDELLETVVDGTRDALHADVSSLYLLDRDGAYLTLAATNGLDHFQIGRARVPFGEGSRAGSPPRASRWSSPTSAPIPASCGSAASTSAGSSRPCCPFRSSGTTRPWESSTSRPSSRGFQRRTTAQLRAVADLLAGIVEKGRQQSEAEARVEALKAIDEARSELIALVTHELRTPLAVVRAYTDLLAEEPPLRGRSRATSPGARPGPPGIARRSSRSSGWTASSTRSWRPSGSCPRARRRSCRSISRRSSRARLAAAAARAPPVGSCRRRLQALADPPRLRQIVEHLVENAVKYAPPETAITIDWRLAEGVVQLGVSDEGPGIPEEWRERIFEPYARRDTHTARGSGIGLYAAKRLGEIHGRPPVVRAGPAARRAIRRRPARRGRDLRAETLRERI